MTGFRRINILGVGVNAIDMHQALDTMDTWINARTPKIVCLAAAHAIMGCQDDLPLRRIYNHSGLTTPDGMAIVWWLRLHGEKHVERVYGPDLMLAVCGHSLGKGYRHYFYGGAPGVAEKLAERLTRDFPGLVVAGMDSPPFRQLTDEEDRYYADRIRASQPDILWVGTGSPRQERWMAENVGRLNVPVLVGVGAAFDFLSGCKPQAPIWVQRSGLEWLFRLGSEPRRLWRRYLLGYPRFVFCLLLQLSRLKRYPIE